MPLALVTTVLFMSQYTLYIVAVKYIAMVQVSCRTYMYKVTATNTSQKQALAPHGGLAAAHSPLNTAH